MAIQKYKRKKYLVSMKFQMKYILYILLFIYLGALVAGWTVYMTTWVTLGEKLANVYPRGRLIYIFKHANIVLLWRLLLITPIFVFIGIRISHRIAGPVYRLKMYIDTLIRKDYSEGIRLRKKDELKDLAAGMDKLCISLREDQEKRAKVIDEVVASLESTGLDQNALADVKTKLKDIKK